MDLRSLFEGLEWLMIALFVFGTLMIVMEIVTPGFGVAGTLGIISLLVGVVVASQIVSPTVLTFIIAVVLAVIVGLLLWLYRSATRGGRVSKLLVLFSKTGEEEGYSSIAKNDDLVGKEGVALTVLRPTGTAEIERRKIDVIADGEYIESGSRIKVSRVEGFRIIVHKIQ